MIKFWTLMSGTSYIASISNPSYTSNPKLAVKYESIKKADIAANEWKRKYGLPVMVHVFTARDWPMITSPTPADQSDYDTDYEDQAHQAFYNENL